MIAVIGAKGNMGRRYSAILKSINKTFLAVDVPCSDSEFEAVAGLCDHYIVATPTDTHRQAIDRILEWRAKPCFILCEKPIAKSVSELRELYSLVELHGSKLYSVNQYAFMPRPVAKLDTISVYDYFNHGKDGIHWDCFQIYALAKGQVEVREISPVWKCQINGSVLNLADMDLAYVAMIENFLSDKSKMWGRDVVMRATERIASL